MLAQLNQSKQILFTARQRRIRPALDDKMLLSWNALFTASLCNGYNAFENEAYLAMAKANISFIEKYLFDENNNLLLHSWNKKTNAQPAFLDDYAALIRTYILLYQTTAEESYL